mgnify:CR=1 FL=1
MANPITVDARGFSCPEPVLMTRAAIKDLKGGAVVVLVDTVTSRNNVTRFAERLGWSATSRQQQDGTHAVELKK